VPGPKSPAHLCVPTAKARAGVREDSQRGFRLAPGEAHLPAQRPVAPQKSLCRSVLALACLISSVFFYPPDWNYVAQLAFVTITSGSPTLAASMQPFKHPAKTYDVRLAGDVHMAVGNFYAFQVRRPATPTRRSGLRKRVWFASSQQGCVSVVRPQTVTFRGASMDEALMLRPTLSALRGWSWQESAGPSTMTTCGHTADRVPSTAQTEENFGR
jgi:hypothetical protein